MNGDLRTPRDPNRGFQSEIDAQPEEEDEDVTDMGSSQDSAVPPEVHVSPPTSPLPVPPPETPSPLRYSEDVPSSSLSAAATASTSAVSLPAVPSSAPVSGADAPSRRSHRSTRSAQGPSIFEQVVSKTRPSFLPPKPKKEDVKHMHDWETMMRQSRAAGQSTAISALINLESDVPQRRSGGKPHRSAGWLEKPKSNSRCIYGRRSSSLIGLKYEKARVCVLCGGPGYRRSYGPRCGNALLATLWLYREVHIQRSTKRGFYTQTVQTAIACVYQEQGALLPLERSRLQRSRSLTRT